MDTLHFEREYVSVRTFALYELAETYIEKRLRPVGRADRDNIKLAFRLLAERFPAIDTSQFDGEHLEEFQRFLIAKDYARDYINKLTGFVKSVYYWCARKKLVSPSIAAELRLVPALQYSESIKENPDREDAKPEDIENVIEAANRDGHVQFADMVTLQALAGLRPCELCGMKTGDIKRETDVFGNETWTFQPFHHKTKWRGHKRSVPLGDVEQTILKKYLPKTDEQTPHVFRNLQRYKDKPMTPATYSRTLAKIIKEHGLKKFTPYQVRHTNATWVSKTLDRDHARAQMGHTSEAMTRKYDHSTDEKQKAVLEVRKTAGCVLSRNVIDRYMVGSQPPSPPPKAMPNRRWIGLTVVCFVIMFCFGSCRFAGQEAVWAKPAPVPETSLPAHFDKSARHENPKTVQWGVRSTDLSADLTLESLAQRIANPPCPGSSPGGAYAWMRCTVFTCTVQGVDAVLLSSINASNPCTDSPVDVSIHRPGFFFSGKGGAS